MTKEFDLTEPQDPLCQGWAAAIGNPFDGITLVGPFKTMEEAQDYGDTTDYEWTAVPLLREI